ncbi:nucleoredoxin-like protein 2 [Haemaphysalis longicornis]
MDLFKGKSLLKKDGSSLAASTALRNNRLICIYFAAQWCPPCRMFTPMLADAYRAAKEESLPIEVVFVSSDRNASEMMNYVKSAHGDWFTLPYGDQLQSVLKARFRVAAIPTLVVLKADGSLVCANGRPAVQDKSGQAFKDWLSTI